MELKKRERVTVAVTAVLGWGECWGREAVWDGNAAPKKWTTYPMIASSVCSAVACGIQRLHLSRIR